ncbi:hypothetical protein [uncultured Zobellia sp.]|uniref:hypothetical protein n=1 Tax=uncultured Zobellia sp. TaxID=255433 RepID=UPI002596D335|nr:hypothetical protein [uncultured Zobellia sp.]
MNSLSIYGLKALRKVYAKIFRVSSLSLPKCNQDAKQVSELIYSELTGDKACMIARFGSTELSMLVNHLGVKKADKSLPRFVQGKTQPWWYEENRMQQMQNWSGFFPPTEEKIQQFCELMLEDIKEVDVLGSWVANEQYVVDQIKAQLVHLRLLEPFYVSQPWTRALKGKKVLVVHPFTETIAHQYKNREKLFVNPDVLPEFASLGLVKAVQSLGQGSDRFADWFDALQWMKDEIDKQDYDVCLIGCGAYGFPLAAHVKRQGKKAVHIGGSLQLLFGIKGKRWEDPNYGVEAWGIPQGFYPAMMNKHWVRPGQTETPKTAGQVEGACYW